MGIPIVKLHKILLSISTPISCILLQISFVFGCFKRPNAIPALFIGTDGVLSAAGSIAFSGFSRQNATFFVNVQCKQYFTSFLVTFTFSGQHHTRWPMLLTKKS